MNAKVDLCLQAFDRIKSYLEHAKSSPNLKVLAGGNCDNSKGYYIEPTIIQSTDPKDKIMAEVSNHVCVAGGEGGIVAEVSYNVSMCGVKGASRVSYNVCVCDGGIAEVSYNMYLGGMVGRAITSGCVCGGMVGMSYNMYVHGGGELSHQYLGGMVGVSYHISIWGAWWG